MTNQKINDVDTITTFSGTDRLLVNTDIVNNVLEQIEKDDFVADIISTDSGNFIDIGTDNKLVLTSTNSVNELVKLNSSGQYPALDGSLITNISGVIPVTCPTAAATVDKAITASGITLQDGLLLLVEFINANTAASSITINLNATGAKSLVDKRGNTPDFSNKAGEKVSITYDLANNRWVLLEAEFYNARMAMPSTPYIDLTLEATGSTYTAPADGYFILAKLASATGQGIQINVTGGVIAQSNASSTSGSGAVCACNCPIRKGQTALIAYNAGGNTVFFRFVYAEGSKP